MSLDNPLKKNFIFPRGFALSIRYLCPNKKH